MANGITVENLNLELTASTEQASDGLKRIKEALASLKGASRGGAGLTAVTKQIEKLNTAVSNIPLTKLITLKKTLEEISKLNGVKISVGGGTSINATKNTEAELTSLRESRKAISENASEVGGLAVATNTLAKSAPKTNKAIKGIGDSAKKATSPISKFAGSLKRILLYRAIRTILKEIGQAFTEGIKNAYQYSKAMDGVFAQSMDKAATSSLYLKNSLGAALMPAINALVPVLEWVVDKFVDFINVVNQLFAILGGQSTWTKAVKKQTEFAQATGGAAKELNRMVLGFDELNKLSSNKGSGSSSNQDFSKMFEEVAIPKNDLTKGLQDAMPYFKTALGGLKDLFSDTFKLIKDIITLNISDACYDAANIMGDLKVITNNTFEGIKVIGDGFFKWLGEKLGVDTTKHIRIFNSNISNMQTTTSGVLSAMQLAFKGLGDFLKGVWTGDMSLVVLGVQEMFGALKNNVLSLFQGLVNGMITQINAAITRINTLIGKINQIPGVHFNTISLLDTVDFSYLKYGNNGLTDAKIAEYQRLTEQSKDKVIKQANGGFVPQGQMFIAGEAGAELITSGRGGAQVTNGSQLADDVALGNEGVVEAINTLIEVVRSKPAGGISKQDIRTAFNQMQYQYGG